MSFVRELVYTIISGILALGISVPLMIVTYSLIKPLNWKKIVITASVYVVLTFVVFIIMIGSFHSSYVVEQVYHLKY